MAETGYAGRYPVLCPFYKGKWCVQDVCSNLPAIDDAYKDAMELGVGNQAAAEIGVKAIVMKPLIHKDLALLVRKVLDEARAAR